MILSYSRGKTKATCECGAQGPNLPNADFNDWKLTETGKEWIASHRPHGKTASVARGGRVETIEESLKKIEAKRKATSAEINQLAEHFEKRT